MAWTLAVEVLDPLVDSVEELQQQRLLLDEDLDAEVPALVPEGNVEPVKIQELREGWDHVRLL